MYSKSFYVGNDVKAFRFRGLFMNFVVFRINITYFQFHTKVLPHYCNVDHYLL